MHITYVKRDYYGFDYCIGELCGHATLYTYTSEYDRNRTLHKYIDDEHHIQGGGFYDVKDAKKDFKRTIELFQV